LISLFTAKSNSFFQIKKTVSPAGCRRFFDSKIPGRPRIAASFPHAYHIRMDRATMNIKAEDGHEKDPVPTYHDPGATVDPCVGCLAPERLAHGLAKQRSLY
jgi:hypothetical protein